MQFRFFFLSLAAVIAATASTGARFSGEAGMPAQRNRLAIGSTHTCEILDDGSVRCWGVNNLGQLGDGTFFDRNAPVTLTGLGPAVFHLAGGGHHRTVSA